MTFSTFDLALNLNCPSNSLSWSLGRKFMIFSKVVPSCNLVGELSRTAFFFIASLTRCYWLALNRIPLLFLRATSNFPLLVSRLNPVMVWSCVMWSYEQRVSLIEGPLRSLCFWKLCSIFFWEALLTFWEFLCAPKLTELLPILWNEPLLRSVS